MAETLDGRPTRCRPGEGDWPQYDSSEQQVYFAASAITRVLSTHTLTAELVDACHIVSNAGLAELYTGHVSARSDEGVLVPAHRHDDGYGLESVTTETIIQVDLDGEPLAGDVEPPSEFAIHSGILRPRPDVGAVAHAHPLYATGLSVAGTPIEPASLDAALLGGSVPVFDPGAKLIHTDAEGAALADTVGNGYAALIRGHGAVTAGSSVAAATTRLYLLERAARLQYVAAQFGGADPTGDPFDGDVLAESGEGFLEEAFEYLRRQYAGERTPPAIGGR